MMKNFQKRRSLAFVSALFLSIYLTIPRVSLAVHNVSHSPAPEVDPAPALEITTLTQDVLSAVVPIVITLALVYFIWGLAEYILSAGDPEKKGEGRSRMIYGIIALFVIVSIWGIVGFLGNVLGIGQGGSAPAPGVESS